MRTSQNAIHPLFLHSLHNTIDMSIWFSIPDLWLQHNFPFEKITVETKGIKTHWFWKPIKGNH